MTDRPTTTEYQDLCETCSMFCDAKGLDAKARDQLATMIGLAMRVGELEYKKRVIATSPSAS